MDQIAEKLYGYAVPSSCNLMYEVGMSFYQREFYFLWNKRERVGNKQEHVDDNQEHIGKKQKRVGDEQEHVDDDLNMWSAPLETGFFCSLDATLYSESVPVASGVTPVPGTT
jgi:hypothetical protein